jgi:hypothetical protein
MEMRCFGIGAEKCDLEPTFGRNCHVQSSHNATQFALLTDLLDVQIESYGVKISIIKMKMKMKRNIELILF